MTHFLFGPYQVSFGKFYSEDIDQEHGGKYEKSQPCQHPPSKAVMMNPQGTASLFQKTVIPSDEFGSEKEIDKRS